MSAKTMNDAELFLGIDIGGTAAKIAIVNRSGEILLRVEIPVALDRYATPVMFTVLEAVERFLDKAGDELRERLRGIGISATGQIDSHEGKVVGSCGNFPGWVGSPLKDVFSGRFSLPVRVANDANCMILGERWLGAARGVEHVVGITLGTGVGGGILIHGRILEGSRGLGGELGHFPIDASAARCSCGLPGCYEQVASVTALLRRVREAGFSFANAKLLCQALAEEGDSSLALGGKMLDELRRHFNCWLNDVALGLAGLVHIFNPELLIVGGGISEQQQLLIRPLREKVLSMVMPEFAKGLRLEAARCGNDAGLLGAVRYWLDREEEKAR